MTPQVVALVPTYNNAAALPVVLGQVRAQGVPLLVVNDGATDGTREILEAQAGLEVVHHGENRGKGEALRTGFRRALELGFTHAVSLDSDGQHDPAQLPRFREALDRHPEAIIVGARDMSGENVPWRSRLGRRLSNQGVAILAGRLLPDTQTGYRAYPLATVLGLGGESTRFEFEIEILVRALWAEVPVLCIPITVHYEEAGSRVSHFRPLRDFLRGVALDVRLLREGRARRRQALRGGR